ncbi:hypothetical protein FNV43_RR00551 [Rhamnella rubrinervis]|uniref:Secreted protein n=1 Tax=Rhamnella rubrinervis TaxID=2594499 RepID=A0A8K0HQV7_9ROSA|nr:hypothetical protein FNV43_RR00551 [Rhamnella rubrinervis]
MLVFFLQLAFEVSILPTLPLFFLSSISLTPEDGRPQVCGMVASKARRMGIDGETHKNLTFDQHSGRQVILNPRPRISAVPNRCSMNQQESFPVVFSDDVHGSSDTHGSD